MMRLRMLCSFQNECMSQLCCQQTVFFLTLNSECTPETLTTDRISHLPIVASYILFCFVLGCTLMENRRFKSWMHSRGFSIAFLSLVEKKKKKLYCTYHIYFMATFSFYPSLFKNTVSHMSHTALSPWEKPQFATNIIVSLNQYEPHLGLHVQKLDSHFKQMHMDECSLVQENMKWPKRNE